MNGEIIVVNKAYVGSCTGLDKPVVTLANLTVTKGILWYKTTEVKEVHVVVKPIEFYWSYCGTPSTCFSWGVINVFDTREEALNWRNRNYE